VLFRGFRFEHPATERTITVAGWSYLWAGLFGAVYVWWIGSGSVLRAVLYNLAFAALFLGALGVTSFLPVCMQFLLILPLVPALVLAQGVSMISMIRAGFRRRGWMTVPA
jgi:hypothetical protein